MVILHISNDYFNSTVYRNLHHCLLKHKVDSYMFVPRGNNSTNELDDKNVIQCKCFNKSDRFFFFKKQKKIIKELEKEVIGLKPSLLHGHFVFSSGFACMKMKKKYNIPYIVTVRNTDANVFFKRLFHLRKVGLRVILNAERVVFLSPSYMDLVINKYIPSKYKELVRNKSIILANGINEFWFKNLYEQDKILIKDKLNLLTVGAINNNKNQLTVAKATEDLIKKGLDVKYTIIGNIEDEKVYNELQNYKFIKFVGQQPKEKLIEYYRDADVFVMPSIQETFGLVYAEAMSQGLPVIYSKGQGFDGQFVEGQVGYHVECLESEDIADKIICIMEEYNEISKRCLLNLNKFSWDKIAYQYIKLYDESEISKADFYE